MASKIKQPTVIRTERGLTISGTRIRIYTVMDYLKAGWHASLIRDRLNLSDRQISDVMEYIEKHRDEVEAEYELFLQQADDNRKYWEKRNRESFPKIMRHPSRPMRFVPNWNRNKKSLSRYDFASG
jgi:uncharacterized protein (DUF433 family)